MTVTRYILRSPLIRLPCVRPIHGANSVLTTKNPPIFSTNRRLTTAPELDGAKDKAPDGSAAPEVAQNVKDESQSNGSRKPQTVVNDSPKKRSSKAKASPKVVENVKDESQSKKSKKPRTLVKDSPKKSSRAKAAPKESQQLLEQSKAFVDSLPRSPIMLRVERITRNPIPLKDAPRGKGRRRLMRNPWARMLASPMRMCTLSDLRLPGDLTFRFQMVNSPDGDKSYLLPLDLANLEELRHWKGKTNNDGVSKPEDVEVPTHENKIEASEDGDKSEIAEAEESMQESLAPTEESTPSSPETGRSSAKQTKKRSPAVHLLPRRALIRHIPAFLNSILDKREEIPLKQQLIPRIHQDQEEFRSRRTLWRADTPEVLLDILQRRVVTAMENVLQFKTNSIGEELFVQIDPQDVNTMLRPDRTGAMIWLDTNPEDAIDFSSALNNFSTAVKDSSAGSSSIIMPTKPSQAPLLSLAATKSIPIFNLRAIIQHDPALSQNEPREDQWPLFLELLSRFNPDNKPIGPWWLLNAGHESAVTAISEIWRMHEYLMHDTNIGEMIAVDTERKIAERRKKYSDAEEKKFAKEKGKLEAQDKVKITRFKIR